MYFQDQCRKNFNFVIVKYGPADRTRGELDFISHIPGSPFLFVTFSQDYFGGRAVLSNVSL